jgi:hypothetical protein
MKSLLELFPRASQSFIEANETPNRSEIPDSEPQRHQATALGGTVEGKEKGVERTIVRFIGYRVRPLDPDNFAGGCKDLLDGLRHAGLLHGDEPWRIIFETAQEKVKSYAEERTVIEIEIP